MRSIPRLVLRVAAFLLLLALLVGAPLVVALTVGVPLPSIAEWRAAWSSRRLSTEFVVHVGAALFVVLWLWFAVTALAEFARVIAHRHEPAAMPTATSAGGPAWWVRGLVRFVAVSSVSAGALLGGLGTGHGLAIGARPASATVAGAAVPSEHVVVAGDSYWRIAQDRLSLTGHAPAPLEVKVFTDSLIELNSERLGHRDPTLLVPGEVVRFELAAAAPAPVAPNPPIVVPAPSAPAASTTAVPSTVPSTVAPSTTVVPTTVVPTSPPSTVESAHTSPLDRPDRTPMVMLGLAGAALLAGGVTRLLDSRRRRGWRAAPAGAVAVVPTFEQVRTELLLRSVSGEEQLARLDVALRAASADLASQRSGVVAATVDGHGDLRLYLRGAAVPTDPRWQLQVDRGAWFLSGAVPLEELADAARGQAMPCPAMLHLGDTVDGAQVHVDLEGMGVLGVVSPMGDAVLRAALAALAVSPFRDASLLFSTGALGEVPGVEHVEAPADAVAAVVGAAAGVAVASSGTSTFALRSSTPSLDSWDPALLVAASPLELNSVGDIGGGRGIGVLALLPPDGEAPVHVLRAVGDHHVLDPLGIRLRPVGIDDVELDALVQLLDAADDAVVVPDPIAWVSPPPSSTSEPWTELSWDLLVRVLGHVDVVTSDGRSVAFDRAKSSELVVWLSQHRERPTRVAARSALWDLAVRDATFANVVSDARRAMARAVPPPNGEEWIARTLSEDLPLHPGVVTDAELLHARLRASRSLPPHEAVKVLRPGVESITGMPFADSTFLWSDAEGITSALVLLATGAAVELAGHHLALGDIDGVFWATGQGLKALPGHEELIALRMRAHASRGDLSGVKQEWESYERALAAEPWGSDEPAPKLAALRRELLSAPVGARH